MPVCKAEAHRALELLEDYYSRLDDSDEKELKAAIERVIKIFKSRLFQALVDIQEFYELTLMDEGKPTDIKVSEAIEMAARWEMGQVPFGRPPAEVGGGGGNAVASGGGAGGGPSAMAAALTALNAAQAAQVAQGQQMLKDMKIGAGGSGHLFPSSVQAIDNWEYDEIILERGSSGLGFSIAGGVDNPHIGNDPSIYITKLIPGGAASNDKRLRVNDIICKVNDVSVVNVSHSVSVEALKRAGNRVVLAIKRRKYPSSQGMTHTEELIEVELFKGSKGLGFTIAGGIGNQHIPGDNGIYVTKVMDGGAAACDGRISVGDRLVAVKNLPGAGDFILDNCTHEEAVNALKKCKEKVCLVVSKTETPYPSSPTIGQMQKLGEMPGMGGQSQPLPRLTRSASDEEFAAPRVVTLKKSAAGLGFNIVGGEDGEGIFVSFILQGGPADVSGQVRRGDRILAVNGGDISGATHEEAAAALKKAGNVVQLTLFYRPEDYEKFEAKINSLKNQIMSHSMIRMSEKRSLFVRALFDYDPTKDDDIPSRGLPFNFGDILYVTNASDDEWWQAKRFDHAGNELETGIIPSKSRWEKKQRARDRNVHWGGGSKNASLRSKRSSSSNKQRSGIGFMRGKDGDPETASEGDTSSLVNDVNDQSSFREADINTFSYELVQEVEIDYTRPVVILGPLKDRVNDELISEYPDKFGSCVPHTTRPRRQFEVNGRDYHFVESREAMEADIQNHKFIEAGQYNDNLYGTSVASVKEVAERGKHCILDVSGNAIKRLEAARLFPIAVFLKPKSPAFILAVNDRMSDEQAEKAYNRALRLEQDFVQYFTAIIDGDDFEQIYEKVKTLIKSHSKTRIWVSANEMF